MKQIFLYLSAERNNLFWDQELRKGIEIIKKNGRAAISPDLITLASISVSKNTDSNNSHDDISIIEESYSWQKDEFPEEKKASEHNSKEEEIHFNDFYQLAEYLHSYSDNNCNSNETSLHILWCVENYIPCPSEVVELYGVFERLRYWHNASLNIITKDFSAVEEWISFLPFQVVCSSDEVVNDILCTLWRGSLGFTLEGKNSLTSSPQVVLCANDESTSLFTLCGIKETGIPLHVLPTAEVFNEVSLNSIPWPFIQKGSLCKLGPSHHLMQTEQEEVGRILSSLTANEGVGTLFRLRHSYKPPSLLGLEAMNTNAWKQMIAEGNFDLNPSLTFEGHHEVVVFLMFPKAPDKDYVHCVALQDPTLYGEDIVKLIMQEQIKSSVQEEEEGQKSKILNLLRETLELSQVQTDAFSHLMLNLPHIIKKRLEKKGQKLCELWDETKLQIEWEASREVLTHIFMYLSAPVRILPLDLAICPETSVTKECWPEFKSLEEKERGKKNAIIRCSSGDYLCGLPPPVTSRRVVGLDAAQLLKCFEEEVKASKGVLLAPGVAGRRKGRDFASLVATMSWREALHTKYPGVHYNSSEQQEKYETNCDRVRDQTVRNETASTCSLFHVQEASSKAKMKLSASTDRPIPPSLPKPSAKPSNDADSCSIASSARSHRFKDSRGQRKRTSPHKRVDVHLRRSPRKRAAEGLKPSDLLSGEPKPNAPSASATQQRRNPKPADLSEVHKQKLRNVVLSSLESEGVAMKHELFKLCFKKLFAVCKPFALDVAGHGATTRNFEKIAKAHVRQVVQFEKRKGAKRK